jgi:hypothetical protein
MRIEVAQRLIEQQARRLNRKRARQSHPLLLPTGQLLGFAISQLAHSHDVERLLHLRFPGVTPHRQSKPYVLPHGHVRPQGIPLETHHGVTLLCRYGRDIPTIEQDSPAGRRLQARNRPQQSGFTATTGTQQKKQLATADFEVDVVQSVRGTVGFG